MDVQHRLLISTNDAKHTMIGTFPLSTSVPAKVLTSKIVTVIILECACALLASESLPRPSREEVLDKASSQFISSDTDTAVNRLFLLSLKPYSPQQFKEFVLMNRLH